MQDIIKSLKIQAEVVSEENNGTMSKYYLRMHPGAKVSKLENCATEIALGLKAYSKPIIRVIPEEGLVCVELLTNPCQIVKYFELKEPLAQSLLKYPLPLVMGRTHDGKDLIADLSVMPHLLVAGTTGSGKSVLLHSIINSLMENSDVKLTLIDPKKVEFSHYGNIKQLLYPIVTEPEQALDILSDLTHEMEDRFRLMTKASVNVISDYNKKPNKSMPYIVVIIDEFSDLMHQSKKIFQQKLCRLAQKSRACGIHLIMATQRPSADVVTGLIKANFPARISCRVSSYIDSRIILNAKGAEKLLGKGDSIINSIGYDMIRFQGAFIDVDEIRQRCRRQERGLMSRVINSLRGVG